VIAGAHHERVDGSGYHRGSAGPQLTAEARLLAAADCYQAMTHARPHRDRLEPERAVADLQAQVRAGRLDGAAVQAVLAVAGLTGQAGRRAFPAGLSDREAQVLALLACGHSNRQIASRLGITPKTAGHHVEHLYVKIGASTRAAAALFALEHGLLP
jgi:DNA-binding NarL/FixJ family response regulator